MPMQDAAKFLKTYFAEEKAKSEIAQMMQDAKKQQIQTQVIQQLASMPVNPQGEFGQNNATPQEPMPQNNWDSFTGIQGRV